jgi:hypothetical protein
MTSPGDRARLLAGSAVRPTFRCGAIVVALLCVAAGAHARLVPCRRATDATQIAAALDTIRRSIDPCGESAQIVDMVDRFERCTRASYEICTDGTASRNLMEPRGVDERGTIIWNPALRSELERGSDGDPARPVMRDPLASLLHELVHAVDDCEGRDPTEGELEAVRVENVYRRAAGLCQRSGYGDQLLGAETPRACAPPADSSSVAAAGWEPAPERETPRPAPGGRDAESVSTTGETVGHPARGVLADAPVSDTSD